MVVSKLTHYQPSWQLFSTYNYLTELFLHFFLDNREQEERLQQLQQSATVEVDAMVSQALANVQLFSEDAEDSERSRGEASQRAEEEEGEGDERADGSPRAMEDGGEFSIVQLT